MLSSVSRCLEPLIKPSHSLLIYYITTDFYYAKRDSRLSAYGGVMLQRVGIEKNVNRHFRVSRKHRPRKRRPQTTDLENADLENTDLENTDLENADLENADLVNADLENTDLANKDVSQTL